MDHRIRVYGVGVGVAVLAIVVFQVLGSHMRKDREPLEKYVSSGGRFTVMLPKRVGTEADTVDTKLGQLHVNMVKARSKFIQFLISHTDYPQEYIDDMGAGQFLLKSAEGVAENFGGTTTDKKSFMQKDNAVHEVTVKARKGVYIRSRVLLIGNRLYQVTAFTNGAHIKDRKISDVFESFDVQAPATPDAQAGANAVDTTTEPGAL